MPAYQGREAFLVFDTLCLDSGATDVDSAMLVDNIQFIPEPTTLLLLGLGFVMVRRKRQELDKGCGRGTTPPFFLPHPRSQPFQ